MWCFCLRDRAASPLHLGHRLRELEEAADPCGSSPATFLRHWDAPSRVLVCRQSGHLPPPRMTSIPSILTPLPTARLRRGGGSVTLQVPRAVEELREVTGGLGDHSLPPPVQTDLSSPSPRPHGEHSPLKLGLTIAEWCRQDTEKATK